MANLYWVGGSGSWTSTSTTNWSKTSGGPGGELPPTLNDNAIFDQSGTYTVTLGTGLTCADLTVSAGTVTLLFATATLNVAGSVSLISGTLCTSSGASTITLSSNADETITTNGVTIPASLTKTGTGTLTLVDNLQLVVAGSAFTLTAGILSLGTNTLTTPIFNSTNSNTRTIDFGTGKIVLNSSTTATIWNTGTVTGLTVSGSREVESIGSGTSVSKTITPGLGSESQVVSFSLLEPAGALVTYTLTGSSSVKNLTFNGTQTVQAATPLTLYGSFTHSNATGTTILTTGLRTWTFAATSGQHTISPVVGVVYDLGLVFGSATSTATWSLAANLTLTSTGSLYFNNGTFDANNKTISGGTSLTINTGTSSIYNTNGTEFVVSMPITHIAGTLSLAGNLKTTSASGYTLTSGTLNLGSSVLTTPVFNSSNTNFRTINFDTGKIVLNGNANATIWNTSTVTSFVVTGSRIVESTGGGTGVTKTITAGSGTEAQSVGFSLLETTGTVTYSLPTGPYYDLTFNGTQTVDNAARTIYGNLTHLTTNGTTTFATGSNVWTFGANSGVKTITSSPGNYAYNFPWVFNGAGSWILQSNLTLAPSAYLTLRAGNLYVNSKTITTSNFSSSTSNVRAIYGPSTFNLQTSLTQTIWDTTIRKNFTANVPPVLYCGGGGTSVTKTISLGNGDDQSAIDVNLVDTSASATYFFGNNGKVGNLAVSGTQTITNTTIQITNNFTYNPAAGTTTFSSGSNPWVLSGPVPLNTGGLTLPFPIQINTENNKPCVHQYGSISNNRPSDTYGVYSFALPAMSQAGTSAFTIEFFMYFDTIPTLGWAILQSGRSDAPVFSFSVSGNTFSFSVGNAGFYSSPSVSFDIFPGKWYHVAVLANSTSTYLAVNGEVKNFGQYWGGSAYTANGNLGARTWFFGGGDPIYYSYGENTAGYRDWYFSQLRFTSSLVYSTSGFAPPVAPLTAIANCLMLTATDHISIRDISTANVAITTYVENGSTATLPTPMLMAASETPAPVTLNANLNIGSNSLQLVNGALDVNGKTFTAGNLYVFGGGRVRLLNSTTGSITTTVPVVHASGNLVLSSNLSISTGYTLNGGSLLSLSSYTLSTPTFTSNTYIDRVINFDTGTISLTGSATTTVWNTSTSANLTTTGLTKQVQSSGGGTGVTKTINTGTTTESQAVSFNLVETTGTVTYTFTSNVVKNLGLNGTQTLTNAGLTFYGSLSHLNTNGNTTITTPYTWTFAATSGTSTITPLAGYTYTNDWVFSGAGTKTLQGNATFNSSRTIYLNSGTLDIGSQTIGGAANLSIGNGSPILSSTGGTTPPVNQLVGPVTINGNVTVAGTYYLSTGNLNLGDSVLTTTAFNSSFSTTRGINVASGKIVLNGSTTSTVWNTGTVTGLTFGGDLVVESTGGGTGVTKTITAGALAESNVFDLSLLEVSGSATYVVTGAIGNLLINGSQTVNNNPITIYGKFAHNSSNGTTVMPAGSNAWTFAATSRDQAISPLSGFTYDFPITFGSAASTAIWSLDGNLTLGATRTIGLTAGTLDLNNYTVSAASLSSNSALNRSIAFDASGQILLSGNGSTIVDFGTMTGYSYSGTPYIYSSYTGATGTRTFNFGGTAGHSRTNSIDLSFGSATQGLVIANSTDTIDLIGGYYNFDLTGLNQTLVNSSRTVYGNLIIPATGGTLTSGTNPTVFAPEFEWQTYNFNGRTIPFPFGYGGTVPFTLTGNMNFDNGFVLSAGELALNDYTLTTTTLTSTGTEARTINFGNVGQIVVTAGNVTAGSNITVLNFATVTNFTYTGVPRIYANYAGGVGIQTFNFGGTAGATPANTFDVSIGTSGSGIVINPNSGSLTMLGTYNNINWTGLTKTVTATTPSLTGNLIVPSTGGTLTGSTNNMSFVGNSLQTIVTNGRVLDFPITVNSTGNVQLSGALTLGATRSLTLTAGNLDLNNNTLTVLGVVSSSSSQRSILFGDSGVITLVGSGTTIWNTSTGTNFSWSGNLQINSTYTGATGTRTLSFGTLHESFAPNVKRTLGTPGFNIGTATDTVALSGNVGDLDLTGFTGILSNAARTVYGNLTIPATGGTLTAGTAVTTLGSTKATSQLISTGGRTIDFPITFNGIKGNWTLTSNLVLGSTRTVSLTAGNITLNNNVITAAALNGSGTMIRSINFGSSGRFDLSTSSATVMDFTTATNFNYTGNPYIRSTYAGATGTRTFIFGSTAGAMPSNTFDVTTSGSTGLVIGTSSDAVALTGSFANVNLTGVVGTITNTARRIFGNLTIPSTGATLTAGAAATTLSPTATPINNGYSVYISGSPSYLIIPTSSAFVFAGDFTVEGWVYFTNVASANPQALFGSQSSLPFDVRWFTNRWQVSTNSAAGVDIGATPAPVNNTWVHIACVRSGSNINLYVNGVSTGVTITSSNTLGYSAPYNIGASNSTNHQIGNISNLRVINGQALYTGTFVPSTTPLTTTDVGSTGEGAASSITGVVALLACQGTIMADASENAFLITPNGTAAISNRSPFSGYVPGITTITTNGRLLDFPVTVSDDFIGGEGAVRLTSNVTVGVSRTSTLTSGNLDLDVYIWNTGLFSSTNTYARAINFNTGKIVLRANATGTIWNTSTATGMLVSGSRLIESTGGGTTTKTINTSATTLESQALNFRLIDTISSAAYAIQGAVSDLEFNGTQTVNNSALTVYGNVTHTSTAGTTTFAAGAAVWTFAGNAVNRIITPLAGYTYDFPMTIGTASTTGSWILAGNLTLGATRVLTLTGGTFDVNNKSLSSSGITVLTGSTTLTNTAGEITIPMAVTHTSGNLSLGANLTTSAATGYTLTAGNLNLGSNKLTTKIFSSSGTGVRAVNFGTGKIVLNANTTSTIWTTATITNLSMSGSKLVESTGGGTAVTKTITPGGGTEAQAINLSVIETTGTATYTLTAGVFNDLVFNGTQTVNNTVLSIYGNLTHATTDGTTTFVAGTGTWSFLGNTTDRTITTLSGYTYDFPMTFGSAASTATWSLAGNLTLGATKVLTLSGGTFNVNDKSLSASGLTISLGSPLLTNSSSGNIAIPMAVTHTSGNLSLGANLTTSAATGYTLTAGNLNLGSSNLTTKVFSSSGTGVRAVNFGTGKIVLNANTTSTIWTTATTTNFSATGSKLVESTGGGTAVTKTITPGGGTEAQSIKFSLLETTGTVTYALTAGSYNDITVNGAQTVNNTALNLYGNLTHATTNGTTTFVAGTNTWSFLGNTTARTITPVSGYTYDFPITFGSAASTATWTLGGSMITGATRTTTLTGGTIDLNGYTYTTGTFATGAGTKSIIFDGGTLSVTAAGTPFNNANPNGFTTSAGTSPGTITLTSASAKTFNGNNVSYAASLNHGGAGNLTINGNNAFDDFTSSAVSTANVYATFASGTTNTFSKFTGNGTSSYSITLIASTAGSAANIYCTAAETGVVSVNYYKVADINFQPFATNGSDYLRWYLGDNSAPTNTLTSVTGVLYQTYNPDSFRKVYQFGAGTSLWAVPSDFNVNDNKIHIFGGGGAGGSGVHNGAGGSGGGYTLLSNVNLFSGQVIGVEVGAGGAPGGTPAPGGNSRVYFYTTTGAQASSVALPNSGGAVGIGTASGGAGGGHSTSDTATIQGAGGGSAASPLGNGIAGTDGLTNSGYIAYTGVAGANTAAGTAGGTAGTSGANDAGPGRPGREILNTFGAGSGGGSGGASTTLGGFPGAPGGKFGGGGGGASIGTSSRIGGSGGAGGDGAVLIEYTASTTSPPPDPAAFGSWFA